MKVSVAMITYNHERFIAQAIESVLMQQTDFEYELLIGEDCSTDRTRDIVLSFQAEYPDRIRLLLSDTNIGPHRNVVRTLQACQGKYIALLEGDDYWTDPHKLQRQVEFLDSHPEYVMCFHNARIVGEDGVQDLGLEVPAGQKQTLTLEDLLVTNPVPTSSVMFRCGLWNELPEWYWAAPIGDRPVWVFIAHHGPIRYINEVMSAFRSGGWHSRLGAIRHMQVSIEFLELMDVHLDPKYKKTIRQAISMLRYRLAREYVKRGDLANARAQAKRCVAEAPLNRLVRTRKLLALLARLYVPTLYRLVSAASRPARQWVSRLGRAAVRRGLGARMCHHRRS